MENNNAEEYIFNSPDYVHMVIEYSGKIPEEKDKSKEIFINIINNEYAILSIKANVISNDDSLANYQNINLIKEIINKRFQDVEGFKVIHVLPPQIYTLQEISAIEASGINNLKANPNLDLTGEGVIIGIIDTGIDYLSEEFRDANGKIRIISIWDQTIDNNENNNGIVSFGTVYNRNEIDRAIGEYNLGRNPYGIVASKDENGHGTGMAGIVGAIGKNNYIAGIAPKCEFVIVKLSEANYLKDRLKIDIPIYDLPFVFSAIEYLKKVLINEKKPVVVLLPLGSNNGNHKGDNIFDSFIESVSSNVGMVIVTGAGNQGTQDGHVSGRIKNKESIEVVEIIIDEKQKFMLLELWVDLPSILEINLVSPSGEETGFVPAEPNIINVNKFIFEKTKTEIIYFLPEEYTGEEMISVYFDDLAPGIWQLKLRIIHGELAVFNAWLLQKGIAFPGTRFSPSDHYGTITIPGDSDFVVTVAAYNQNNNNLLAYSGVSFRSEYTEKIDFTAGGVNTMTVGLNNSMQVINGTSLAAAIGAGACVLLFQWGIVQKNYPYMYSQSIKTFLRRGVIKRQKENYPNPEWGYGIINFYKIFESML